MDELKFGIVGCGMIHSTHARALAEVSGARLEGVFDIVPEKAGAAAESLGVIAFDSLPELCDKVDAVTVCTPSGLHAEVGIEAAKRGRHVLCEKPIDVSAEKASQLIEVCKERRVTLGVISQHRFAPEVRAAREKVINGELGKILQCDVYNKWYRTQGYYDSADWRGTRALDGGCLMNQGIHYVDLAQWMMGGAESVIGQTATLAHQMECEDNCHVIVRYRNGAIGSIHVSTACYPGFAERIEIHGTIGSLTIEGDRLTFLEVDADQASAGFYGKGVMAHPVPPAESTAGSNPTNLWDVLHRIQIQDFVDAVREDRAPAITGEDAILSVREILAVYESAAAGGNEVPLSSNHAP
jgi:predicted dehydrogenase